MPYIDRNGQLVDKPPWSTRVVGFFWGIVMFFWMFLKTMMGQNVNRQGSSYTREYRGGGGPPRPPSNKRIGGFATLKDCNVPGGG